MKWILHRKDNTTRTVEMPDDILDSGPLIVEHEHVLYVRNEIGELVEARMVVIT
jgi:hypothetical protein